MIKGIEHIGIAAKDSTALKNWYMDIFNMTVVSDNGRGGYFIAAPNGVQIEIYPANSDGDRNYDNLTSGLRHIAFLVEDFDGEYERLKGKNVNFVGEPSVKEKFSNLFFKDPEGNLVHIIERR